MKTEDLLNEIEETISSGHKLLIFKKRIVDGDLVIALVDEARESLPEDFLLCKKIKEDRDEIIRSATAKATGIVNAASQKAARIVDDAEREAAARVSESEETAKRNVAMAQTESERLVSESNITHVAQQKADQLAAEAQQYADRIMSEADEACTLQRTQTRQWSDDLKNSAYNYVMNLLNESERFLTDSANDLAQTKGRLNMGGGSYK